MAPSTPMTAPNGSTTANNHPHPMSPTATDILSRSLFCMWSERVVAEDSLMDEQHLKRLEGWATKYTNVETLRSEFGSTKNKLWGGNLDPISSRKLYHVLLPRALLGLHELGVTDLEDLAPLAYEARVAAKQYARERCAIPGHLGAMLFDGWRQWKRSYGKFNPHSMSSDQLWAEYETQLLQDYDDFHEHDVDDMDDERLTRDICLKILERPCITNDNIDRLFYSSKSSSSLSSSSYNKGRLQKEFSLVPPGACRPAGTGARKGPKK
eukprot:scaffold33355_cov36-Attheya_sp.AAC.10